MTSSTQSAIRRIFLSSTAEDLADHRAKASVAIAGLQHLAVRMEDFSAAPQTPVRYCLERVSQSDALVAILAHRYGWVPKIQEGGDGEKSITRLEIEAAMSISIPIFAFLVDEKYPWIYSREQDRMLDPAVQWDPKRMIEIGRAVARLIEFKDWLKSAGLITRTFTTPDDLALQVAVSLATWARSQSALDGPQIAYQPPREIVTEEKLGRLRKFSTLLPKSITISEAEPILHEHAKALDLEPAVVGELIAALRFQRGEFFKELSP